MTIKDQTYSKFWQSLNALIIQGDNPSIWIDGVQLNVKASQILDNFIQAQPSIFKISFNFKETFIAIQRNDAEDPLSSVITPIHRKYTEFAHALHDYVERHAEAEILKLENVFDDLTKIYQSIEIHVPYILNKFLATLSQDQLADLTNNNILKGYRQAVEQNTEVEYCHNFMQLLNDVMWMEDDYWLLLQLQAGNSEYQKQIIEAETTFDAMMKFARLVANNTKLPLEEVSLKPLQPLLDQYPHLSFDTIELNHRLIGDFAYFVVNGAYAVNPNDVINEWQECQPELD